jgi:hypothetical protein
VRKIEWAGRYILEVRRGWVTEPVSAIYGADKKHGELSTLEGIVWAEKRRAGVTAAGDA